ncbi:flavin-containing monooxygenase [Pseudonocardia sp. RS010]|uniref:flavin-containing monooxygenase n=1 Tax=Pseudonocardia sp. RS010 TaxID=3385979 RepID=UPI0039A0CB8F
MVVKSELRSLSRHEIRRKLEAADTATLLLALVEMTGDTTLLARWGRHIEGPTPETSTFPAAIAEEIRDRVTAVLTSSAAPASDPLQDPLVFHRLADTVAGRPVTETERDLVLKEMGLLEEAFVDWRSGRPSRADTFPVVIIGAGLSAIAIAIHLKRMAIPFTILDRNTDVGGTWLVNTYPGCGVDIASHYFSYSFARNPGWTRYYAKQPEILAYVRDCVQEFGLTEHLQLGTTVHSAVFDEDSAQWVLRVAAGGEVRTVRARAVVSGVGSLSVPSVPALEGQERFAGKAFHSAEWDPEVDLAGKRVVLVGNGASANQIGPAIAPHVSSLTVLQRSPQWINGVAGYHSNVPMDERWVLANIPAYERWFRVRTMMSMNDIMRPAALVDPDWDGPEGTINAANQKLRERLVRYMSDELGEKQELLAQLLPSYPPMMKRMLRDNGWCRMFRRANTELVTGAAAAFTERGLVDEHGVEHEADVVIFATGFRTARQLSSFEVVGRDGVTLRDAWGEEDPRAYLGIVVPQFPNMFILYGPNTNVGVGGSIFFQAEAQSGFIARMIRDMIERDVATAEVRQDVFEDYNSRMDAELEKLIWSLPVGSTWYRNSKGRVTANMPWTSTDYWDMTRTASMDVFDVRYVAPDPATDFDAAVSESDDDLNRELEGDVTHA